MLSQSDAAALINLRAWVRSLGVEPGTAELRALRQREESLSPEALAVWRLWPSSRLAAELARWVSAYRLEATARGWRAFRWIGRRKQYAKRPCATRLPEREADALRASLVRVR